MPNTVRLYRVLATRPEKVYRTFLEADALAKWLPPNGFACTVHHLEPKVGGTFRVVAKPGKARRIRNQSIAYQQSNRGRGRPRQP